MNSRRQTFCLLSNGTSSRSFPHVGQRAWYIGIPADLAALWASHCTSSMRREDEMVWGVGSSLWAWISLRSKLIFRRLNSGSGWASVPHTVFDGSHVAGDTIWSYPPSKVFLPPTHIFFFFFLSQISAVESDPCPRSSVVHTTKVSVVPASHRVQFNVS